MWYVLYTKPRNEKKTAKLLEENGVQVYCPVQEVVKQWSDRKKKVQEPLFRSYIFIYLHDYQKEHVPVLETPGAVRFLWWLKKPAIVREEEIEAIKQFLNDYRGAQLTVAMRTGEEVIIAEGPLQAQKGKIIKLKGNKAVLHVPSLGWNITAEIPVQALRKQ